MQRRRGYVLEPGSVFRTQWLAAVRTASASRAAAFPVGAASATRGGIGLVVEEPPAWPPLWSYPSPAHPPGR